MAHRQPRETFFRALRQGIGSSGQPLDPTLMPWVSLSRMDEVEIAAIRAYLDSLPE